MVIKGKFCQANRTTNPWPRLDWPFCVLLRHRRFGMAEPPVTLGFKPEVIDDTKTTGREVEVLSNVGSDTSVYLASTQ